MTYFIKVGNKFIGEGEPVFIIGEAGVNHNGDFGMAKKLIDVAYESGVDAVKFQTFDPRTLVTKSAPKAKYQNENIGGAESHYMMLERLKLKREWHKELKEYAERKGLIFLSTPFSASDADFLFELGVVAFKVGSTDTNNIPYLQYLAKKHVPLILSTGMSTLEEVREAVSAIRDAGNNQLVVLHCTTNYPTLLDEANVRAMVTMRNALGVPTGYSDHTLGMEAAVAAVALGATILEKHFTLNRSLVGPDHKASLEPHELKSFVALIRNTSKALGSGEKVPNASEVEIAKVARKSLVASRFIPAHTTLIASDIVFKRPGTGIPPKHFNDIVGKKIVKNVEEDELFSWDILL